MPRCSDGKWCIDDMCHWGGRTLCGLEREDFDLDGEHHDPLNDYDADDLGLDADDDPAAPAPGAGDAG